MKLKMIAGKVMAVTAVILTMSTTLLTGSASAATQFPSSDGKGISVDWSGSWANLSRLEDITLQLCDATPADKNKATAQLEAYVSNGLGFRIETAPSTFQVPIGDKRCKEWRNVFLAYASHNDHVDYVRVKSFGSGAPNNSIWTRWVRNPYVSG